MNLDGKFWLHATLLLLWKISIIKGTLYSFLVDSPRIFQDCKNEPNYLGLGDFLDLSDFKVEFREDDVHIEGSATCLWDVNPDDRVKLHMDVLKHERGSWQPTVYTIVRTDLCKTLFDENDIWYKSWGQYVPEDERKCPNNKGHIYHHEPFNLETVVDVSKKDISGRYKAVAKLETYNISGEKQPNSVCLEILGDVVKK